MNRPIDITALLEAWNQGDLEVRDQLIPAVYDELRRRAAAFLRRERAAQTLQPTALGSQRRQRHCQIFARFFLVLHGSGLSGFDGDAFTNFTGRQALVVA